jgi:hypothetical protein
LLVEFTLTLLAELYDRALVLPERNRSSAEITVSDRPMLSGRIIEIDTSEIPWVVFNPESL